MATLLRTAGLQQLLHYDVTTYCCETLAQTSDHFPMLPFSNSVLQTYQNACAQTQLFIATFVKNKSIFLMILLQQMLALVMRFW